MSVPAPRPLRNDGRWETIKYALDSWARTLRLCLIWLVMIAAPVAVAHPLAELIRSMLLCGARAALVTSARPRFTIRPGDGGPSLAAVGKLLGYASPAEGGVTGGRGEAADRSHGRALSEITVHYL